MTLYSFDLNAVAPSPWKNGGGATRELVCWPPGADLHSFGWRVSVATIDQSGPFSAFAGVDRQIMLLDGDGVCLRSPDGSVSHTLDQRWQPFAFDGSVALECALLGGTSTDFNLMLRQDAWQGVIEVAHVPVQPGASPAGLCMVLAGEWTCEGHVLTAGQGWWWDQTVLHGTLSPCQPTDRESGTRPALAWVALAPKSRVGSAFQSQ